MANCSHTLWSLSDVIFGGQFSCFCCVPFCSHLSRPPLWEREREREKIFILCVACPSFFGMIQRAALCTGGRWKQMRLFAELQYQLPLDKLSLKCCEILMKRLYMSTERPPPAINVWAKLTFVLWRSTAFLPPKLLSSLLARRTQNLILLTCERQLKVQSQWRMLM